MAVTRDSSMGKPVEPGLLNRVVQGVRYMLSGQTPDTWMGPGQPLQPVAQEQAKGRQFDYPTMVNTQQMPRSTEGTTFQQLRNLADGYDLLRLVIESRKDQIAKMKWSFGLKEKIAKRKKAEEAAAKAKEQQSAKAAEPPPEVDELTGLPKPKPPAVAIPEVPKEDPRIEELEAFFAFPDQEHDWDTWLRALLEDMLVLDAATIYPRDNLGGGLYGLELIDGATITRKVDITGRTPQPPDVAYQQIIKGMPAVDYHRDELLYRPRNVRTNRLYGYGPVEQIIMTVNIALRRQVSQLQYYTEGNVPEALIGVPEDWNASMVKEFQEYWDSLMEGNTATRRHAKFVPGGMTPVFVRPPELKDMFDEWLARIICYAFSLSPQALIKETNRSVAESMQEAALQEGLMPLMKWVKSIIDYVVVKYFGYTDLEFKWEAEAEQGPKEKAETLALLKDKGIIDDDEARAELGRDPYTPEQRERAKPPAPPPIALGGPPRGGSPGDAPANAPATGGTGKPVGKLLGSGLRKAKRLSRARASVQRCESTVGAVMGAALTVLGEKVAKRLSDAIGKAKDPIARARKLLDEMDLDELDDYGKAMVKALQEMFADGGTAALAQVLKDVGEEQLAQVNKLAVMYAEERAATLVKSIKESTRDMLRATITEAIEEGWSTDKLKAEILDNYAFNDARAETIARTEAAFADVAGNLEGWRQSGVVVGKQWIMAQDEYCDDCEALDGVVVALDEDFPGDGGDGPPLHPNCRCDIIPLLDKE